MSSSKLLRLSVLAGVWGSLLACPAPEPTPDAGPTRAAAFHGRPGETGLAVPDEVPLAELCEALVEVACDFSSRCDPSAPYLRIESCRGDDHQPLHNCMAELQAPIEARVANGTVAYRGDQVSACLRAVSVAQCVGMEDLDVCAWDRFTDGLQPRSGCCYDSTECSDGVCRDRGATGQGQQGRCGAPMPAGSSPCFADGDCESGVSCLRGTCRARSAEGQECGQHKADCERGLACVGETGNERCAPHAPFGQRCGIAHNDFPPCLAGLVCVQREGREFGVCGDYLQEGEPCDDRIACSPGLRCSAPQGGGRYACYFYEFGGDGDRCQVGEDVQRCDSRTFCDTPVGDNHGFCSDFPIPGEACDGETAHPCRLGWCQPSGCTDPASAACAASRAGTCAPHLSVGDTCVKDSQCGVGGGKLCKSSGGGRPKVCTLKEQVALCE